MQENDNEQHEESGGEFEKPKDEFLFLNKVFKLEEKKFSQHARFEEIGAKFWQLLRADEECDISKPTIDELIYSKLMHRIYKVLLPLYRQEEMKSEISQEWIMDSNSLGEMNFNQFVKVIVRIAHQWCVHIDIDEYIEMMQSIYMRITKKKLFGANNFGSYTYEYPQIQVLFPFEEKRIQEEGMNAQKQQEEDDWMECRSNESNRSDYEYKYEEDPANMMVKKFKKHKPQLDNVGGAGDMKDGKGGSIKEPIIFIEEVTYENHAEPLACQFVLCEIEYVYPLGFIAEQYINQTKNDVHSRLCECREQNRLQIIKLKREMREQNKDIDLTKYEHEDDNGIIAQPNTERITVPIHLHVEQKEIKIQTRALVSTLLINDYRKQLRFASNLSIRHFSQYPKPGSRTKSRTQLRDEPITEMNKFGYNPALERRISYRLYNLSDSPQSQPKYINIYYILRSQVAETAYRSDVQRVETNQKLSIKESEEQKKEEEFVNVETSYVKVRQIMLQKKFGNIYQDRQSLENKEQKRMKKLIEKEEKRREEITRNVNLLQKNMQETYEDRCLTKMMRGPFYQLESQDGIKEDNFVYCNEDDLLNYANTQSLRILIIGKPRSGKTTLAKNLSVKMDLVHISIDNWINSLLTKIKNYEAPTDLEEGQEPPKFLTDLEETVYNQLKDGYGPNEEQQIEIIKAQIQHPTSITKGYVLDLNFCGRETPWANIIRYNCLLGQDEDEKTIELSHVIELQVEDEDIMLRSDNMRQDLNDGVVYSKWEREERKKPKPIPEGEDPPEEEENPIKPLDESSLVQRICDTEPMIKEELSQYNQVERPALEELLLNLYEQQLIKVDAAGLIPEEITNIIQVKLNIQDPDLPLRPIAVQIEGGSDFKSLLREGLEDNQISRKWSLWRQVDPVALADGKLVVGSPEYAAQFANYVFVFVSEENMKAFLSCPKKYIQKQPTMPQIYRLLIIGPKSSGKHTMAQKLEEIYGWRVIDFKQVIQEKIQVMSEIEQHIPNNPMEGGRIGMNEEELKSAIEGKSMQAWKFIPWIFDYLGYELEKKRPPPAEPKDGEEQPPEEELDDEAKKKKELEMKKKKEEEEKKKKEEEEIQRQKEERRKKRQEAIDQGLDLVELGLENEEEEIIIIEDLSIEQLALKIDDETQKAPFVGGFILLGFPETEEQMTKLKEQGIEFDKVIYLQDTAEENPGQELIQRRKKTASGVEGAKEGKDEAYDECGYEYEGDVENCNKVSEFVKQQLTDEIVKEISCNGSIDTVFIRIRNEIDPFYLKVDNQDDVRVTADLSEEDKPLPKGDFADYCPVTYVKDNWLMKGTSEFEATVYGRTYWMSGEKELEEFKFNPTKYMTPYMGLGHMPLDIPPPKIMVIGQKGSGVTTLIRMLCDKYKLDEFNLKEEYLKKLTEEKEKRKRRRQLDKGFKPPLPPEEESMPPPPDPEIEDDPEDFEMDKHQREVLQQILDSKKGLVIDGKFQDLPEQYSQQTLQDLLFESRRMPEIVILLKCKEESTFKRIIDFDSIKQEYDKLMEIRAENRRKAKEEDRKKKEDELNVDEEKTPEEKIEELKKWDEDREAEDEAAEENDPEKPNLEEMQQKFKDTLKEQIEKDQAFMEDFGTAMKAKNIFVIDDIKTDISSEYVFIKVVDKIKDHFINRKDILEKMHCQKLKSEEVPFYEKSYTFKQSIYGRNSPLCLEDPAKTKQYGVLYRERIYYLSNADQQDLFIKTPTKFVYFNKNQPVPLDVNYTPRICVLGISKSGKSTLAKFLAQQTKIVHLTIPKIIENFLERDSVSSEFLRKMIKNDGKIVEDEFLISIICKRLQMPDCQQYGWVLEDFPRNNVQATYLAKRGIVPTNVFYLRMDMCESIVRNKDIRQQYKFGTRIEVQIPRLQQIENHLGTLISFYQRIYNNVTEIDMNKSIWFVQDSAINEIKKNIKSRQEFARDYTLRQFQSYPCIMKNLHYDRVLVKQSLSEFKYFCPVTWKNEKQLFHCSENYEDCLLHKDVFYFFKGQSERDIFIQNPDRFTQNTNFPKKIELPVRLLPHQSAQISHYEKALSGYCSVSLMDEERVIKGDQLLIIHYKDNKYAFDKEFKLQKFLQNPTKYSKATLPVKMPPHEDKIQLFHLSKMDDSIAFLEQSLGSLITKALRDVSENRLKYPTISIKETMLKLFALCIKVQNPANTPYMTEKYSKKMKEFIIRCELPEEIYDLAIEKFKKSKKNQWPEFKENYYNKLGSEYDTAIKRINQEKQEGFINYIR